MTQPLKGASNSNTVVSSLEQLKAFFIDNRVPYYFISATNFNVLNLEQWIGRWQSVCLADCFDGANDSITVLANPNRQVFNSIEELNRYLINHKDFLDVIEKTSSGKAAGQVLFLFYDEELERMARSLGLQVCLPPHALREDLDSKITTTLIAEQAGVPSVPNVLAQVTSYSGLRALADEHQLGDALVVQLPYGDSGRTTYFIRCEQDYDRVAEHICSEDQVKVMREIRCQSSAIEAVTTANGTFVGPLLTELVGVPELTPFAGGWCGNELYPNAFSHQVRTTLLRYTERLGEVLYQVGYRGYFEVDYLLDQDDGAVYLGELNPRLSGATALTNNTAFSRHNVPLLLLHLAEYRQDLTLSLDPGAFNQACLAEAAKQTLAQAVFKYTKPSLSIVSQAPESGIYQLREDGSLSLIEAASDPLAARGEDQCFIMNFAQQDGYVYPGADLAVVFCQQILQGQQGSLTESGQRWIKAVAQRYNYRPLSSQEQATVQRYAQPGSIKQVHSSD